jgi:glycosyltransferase involved in cell wall biosynthesis
MLAEQVSPSMKIAVCGAHKPFMRGGAEMLMSNLVIALEDAGHQAELIRLPVAWDRVRLFDAALAWRLVPVDADAVIATNFPSYFVRHPNKLVWLLHQHRAAYDAADTPWSDIGYDTVSLEVQRMLAEWDTRALEESRAVFAVSQVAAQRLKRFNGLSARVLYHPPPLSKQLHAGSFGDYVFAPMRLEWNKRPQLALDALPLWEPRVRLVLTGPGSLERELQARSSQLGVAQRLRVTGFLSDAELVEMFAGALAVVYAPLDEDYGYVALQACLAGKPVVTSQDSGGVLEWVEDGVNGFVTDGTAAAIAAAVNRLAVDPGLAARMGEKGRARVAALDWAQVVRELEAALRGQRPHTER